MALDGIPEAKRKARDAKPAASAPAAHFPAASSGPAASFLSAGNAKPAEESWEDIAHRTGQTAQEVLDKKIMFKKGIKPEKKVEELVPMVKELRCGWVGAGRHLWAAGPWWSGRPFGGRFLAASPSPAPAHTHPPTGADWI